MTKTKYKNKPTKEIDIIRSIIVYLNYRGFYVFRVNAGMMFHEKKVFRGAPKGVADIIGITPQGKFIAIEVKTPKNKDKVTSPQQAFLDTIKRKNGIAFVSVGIEDIQFHFREI